MDLFGNLEEKGAEHLPLAVRMRPRDLKSFFGQEHILGKGKLLNRLIEADKIMSLIFYGPPGVGKTALGHIVSRETKAHFEMLNAAMSNVQEVRKILEVTDNRARLSGKRTILFLDEIHRFNKAQQDILLPYVENGNPILIGSTTQNPFFSINAALVSRSQIFEFKALNEKDILDILKKALEDQDRGLGNMKIKASEEALRHIAKISDGDARRALSALELGVLTSKKDVDGIIHFDLTQAEESIQRKAILYDKDGDQHYDTISAFIKSMRGSDPDATLYWLAKMLDAGEDIRFILRRIAICAAEDVGMADPQALMLANAAWQISEMIGMPEARIPIAEAAVYIATAPKSNAAYLGIDEALDDIKNNKLKEVPDYLKDASYKGAKRLKREGVYQYAHNYDNHYVDQEYVKERKKYYRPTELGYEKKIKEWLAKLNQSKEN